MYELDAHQEVGASDSLNATGDAMTFTPTSPVEIIGFGYIVTTSVNDGGGDGFIVKLDKRPTAGSDASRGDGDLGTLTLTTAQAASLAAGDSVQSKRGGAGIEKNGGSGEFAGPAPVEAANVLLPGEQAVLEITDAVSTAGDGLPFILYRRLAKADRATGLELIVAS